MMNISFIPVRGGSKSIPMKNIRILDGKPLVYWTAKAANNAKCIDKVVIATDNEEIKKTILSFELEKVEIYDRQPENAQDSSSTESVMLEFIKKSKSNEDNLFFLIQATSPLLKSEHIDNMYQKFIETEVDSMFTGVREKQFHWIEKDGEIKPINYDYKNRPRRQDFQGLIVENGACYINSVNNILRDKCRLSGKIGVYELPPETAFEIDEEKDFLIVETLLQAKC